MKVYFVFPLESPHRGDSNEYTQYTIFNMNKKDTINYPKPAAMFFFSKGLKNEFETAVVNEPPVFEPLKFYCSSFREHKKDIIELSSFLQHLNMDINDTNKSVNISSFLISNFLHLCIDFLK